MSLSVLVQGTLIDDPQTRQGASGKPFCTGLMRVPVDGEDAVLASLIAFDKAVQAALLALHKGDQLAVAGLGKLTAWTGRDGTERRGLGVTVTAVLSAYAARKAKRATAESGGQDDER